MSLLLALLIIAVPALFFIVVLGRQFLAASTLPAPKSTPALDERDLLDTDPREWVRQAEQAVEREYARRLGSQARPDRVRQWADDRRPRGLAPRLTCVICGAYATPHTHYLNQEGDTQP